MTSPISIYLKYIESELIRGDATEHTHRPALKTFIESISPGITATNEPTHVVCGAPDFVISSKAGVIGYVETKDVGINLTQTERSDQIKRYLPAFRNFILTDYLEFRWYVDGVLRRTINIASTIPQGSGFTIKINKTELTNLEGLLTDFLTHIPEPITSPNILAQRLARLAHLIRDGIIAAFNQNQASETLMTWRATFAKILIAGLDKPEKLNEFADMFAQTLAYGLFSARIMDETAETFSLDEAKGLIPETNPFLRDFFYDITGPKLKREPFSTYVDDLVDLLAHSDMDSILAKFGKRTRTEDPVVHFYETFLAAYDPKLREMRGVYYTPQPVVDFIVRAVDEILKSKFNLKDGIADSSLITSIKSDEKQNKNQHKVLILDPACGTGTFLYNVIDLIRNKFMKEGNAGMWSGYVKNHLLPRLYGFEILMAPYAVAHFKLALQLKGLDLPETERKTWAYDFSGDERVNIFLTNTLEEPHEYSDLPLFMSAVANETRQANKVKQELPIMVILGNPPYSVTSENKGEWIIKLIHDAYYPIDEIKEANPKMLLDDYVKFIRWAQWRIEQTGSGVIGFISNNGYLDNPTFRNMRKKLLDTFELIFLLNLHGNSKKGEKTPTGEKDENVFDIQQGVSIGLFIKFPKDFLGLKHNRKEIYYQDLWGSRNNKYEKLTENSLTNIKWKKLEPEKPFYLFIPSDKSLKDEYEQGWKVTDIFTIYSTGIKTHRDHFAFAFDRQTLETRINDFINLNIDDEILRDKYNIPDTRDWILHEKREHLRKSNEYKNNFIKCTYRPFDLRETFFSSDIIELPRLEIMKHLVSRKNIGLITCRQQSQSIDWSLAFVSNNIVETCTISNKTKEASYVFPLNIYETNQSRQYSQDENNVNSIGNYNINYRIIEIIKEKFGSNIPVSGQVDPIPKMLFSYVYGILYSRNYRKRYNELLKTDFPKIPISSNYKLFSLISKLGSELIDIHLLRSPRINNLVTSFPKPGENYIEKVNPTFTIIQNNVGRIYINQTQYFDGVPEEVWNFYIGSYKVLDKWLKDRRGRQLTYDDLTHYQKVVVALTETIRIMNEIDKVIPEWPIK